MSSKIETSDNYIEYIFQMYLLMLVIIMLVIIEKLLL